MLSFLLPGGRASATYADFMWRQGWSEGQKSGNQVNYGRRLADKSEREGSFFFFLFLVICLNAAGSSLHAWPDPAACFVGYVLTSLTRYVLTPHLPLECHPNPPSVAHLQILQTLHCFSAVLSRGRTIEKRRDKAARLAVPYLIKDPR